MADLKLAFRTLARTPFVTAVAILSLALGIGANAAIYSLLDQMLLAALPVHEPERLVNLSAPGPKPGSQSCNQAGDCDVVFSHPMFLDLAREQRALAGLAAHRVFGANLALGDETVSGEGMLVSGSYFPLLGTRPALGRLLTPADDRVEGEHPVVVLGHRFWQNRLAGDPDVLNGTLVINGRAMTVVGVAPRGFEGTTLGARPDVFVPITMRSALEPTFDGHEDRRSYWVYVFGRLKPGGTLAAAAADLNGLYRGILAEVEAPLQEGMSEATMERFLARQVTLEEGRRGQSSIHGEARTPLLLLLGITGVVLLIACANIANLLLARGAGRLQEMAIRGSMGATRSQMLRQLMTESLLLAGAGGVASLLVAAGTLRLVGSLLPPEASAVLALEVRPAVILFTGAVALGTGFLFGLFPAIHSTRLDLVTTLKQSAGQPSGARAAARFRRWLVTAQIALSMALLVAAGLFIRSLVNVSRVEIGIRTENLLTFAIAPQLNGYEIERSRDLFLRAAEELAAVPGVSGVSYGMVPVLAGSSWGTDVSVQGFESGPDVDDNSRYNAVGTDYFRTLGIPLLAGREFDRADTDGAAEVAIVNEAFAAKFGLDPRTVVGTLMGTGGEDEMDMQIVGLVRNAKYAEVKDSVPAQFFVPYQQAGSWGAVSFYVRSDLADPGPILRAIPGVIHGLDPNLPVEDLKTVPQQVRENVFLDRMISSLSAAFAALATLLAAVGLYGVLAYTVTQRTREIGVRMALGAGRPAVRGLVLRQVGGMFLVGGAIGIVASILLGRAAASLLFGLEGHDPFVVVAATVLLSLVAIGAGYVPALRASRVDPMQALRYE